MCADPRPVQGCSSDWHTRQRAVEAVAEALVRLGHEPPAIKTERFGPTGGCDGPGIRARPTPSLPAFGRRLQPEHHGCSAIDRSRLSSLGGTSVLLFVHACEVGVCIGVVVDVECQGALRADLEVGAVALVADADD